MFIEPKPKLLLSLAARELWPRFSVYFCGKMDADNSRRVTFWWWPVTNLGHLYLCLYHPSKPYIWHTYIICFRIRRRSYAYLCHSHLINMYSHGSLYIGLPPIVNIIQRASLNKDGGRYQLSAAYGTILKSLSPVGGRDWSVAANNIP